jgi:GAF domain-containing protein
MSSSSNVPASAPEADSIERFYSALANIGDLVASMPQPQALYAGIVDIFERHVGALLVIVGELDYEAGVMRRRAPARVPAGEEDIYPETVPLAFARPLFWEGRIDVEANIAEAPGRESLRPAYVRHGIRSSAAVPVRCFGKIHSALILRSSAPEFFTPQLLQLLERVALSISHALEGDAQRSRLDHALLAAERSQRALRLLSEILKAATHAGMEHDLLDASCRVVVEVGAYPVCWVGLLTSDPSPTVEARAHAGRGSESYRSLKLRLADPGLSTSVTAAVVRSGEPVVQQVDETGGDIGSTLARKLGLGALLGLPLRLHGQLAGVIVVGADTADAFSDAEIRVFEETARELSLGLERLRASEAQALAEKQLQANLRRFQAILASEYAGILVMDMTDRVQFCNATLCRMYDVAGGPSSCSGCPRARWTRRPATPMPTPSARSRASTQSWSAMSRSMSRKSRSAAAEPTCAALRRCRWTASRAGVCGTSSTSPNARRSRRSSIGWPITTRSPNCPTGHCSSNSSSGPWARRNATRPCLPSG